MSAPESLLVRHAELPWRATPCPGVQWKKLRFDAVTGESAVLLKFAPGAAYDAHRHPAGEQYWVLEGELVDMGERYGPGSYGYHPPGSVHRPRSDTGCVVFVTLRAAIEVIASAGETG